MHNRWKKINFRGTLAGTGQQGLNESDRQLHFEALLDDPRDYGADPRLMTKPLTLGMVCAVIKPRGAEPCQHGGSNGRSDSIEKWIANGYARWDFKFPADSLTDRDKLTHIDFNLIGSPGAAVLS
ncbi:hypothetical protein GCM10020000_08860 [Streptomyces olivoverticillatus]